MLTDYFPVLLQVIAAVGFVTMTLILSVLVGRRGRWNAVKDGAYECGMPPMGDGAPRFSVKFYLVAMLFVLFDIEVVFMYPWAVQFRDLIAVDGMNGMMLFSMAAFVGVLGIAYLYVLKKGALNWKA